MHYIDLTALVTNAVAPAQLSTALFKRCLNIHYIVIMSFIGDILKNVHLNKSSWSFSTFLQWYLWEKITWFQWMRCCTWQMLHVRHRHITCPQAHQVIMNTLPPQSSTTGAQAYWGQLVFSSLLEQERSYIEWKASMKIEVRKTHT